MLCDHNFVFYFKLRIFFYKLYQILGRDEQLTRKRFFTCHQVFSRALPSARAIALVLRQGLISQFERKSKYNDLETCQNNIFPGKIRIA